MANNNIIHEWLLVTVCSFVYSYSMIENISQLSGNVDLISFSNFCRGHALMLFPAFHVQV